MNDDKSPEVIKRTDLSNEANTDRGVVRYQLTTEKATIKASKTGLELHAESSPGTAQNKALTTLYLAVAIGAITGVARAIGIQGVTAIVTGLAATIAAYLLVHFTS